METIVCCGKNAFHIPNSWLTNKILEHKPQELQTFCVFLNHRNIKHRERDSTVLTIYRNWITSKNHLQFPHFPSRWRNRRLALIFSCKNTKITISCRMTIKRECWNPPKNNTPCPRAKEKCNRMIEGVQSWLKSNLRPAERLGGRKHLCAPGLMEKNSDPHKTLSQTCPWVSPTEAELSSDLSRRQGLRLKQT